VTAERVARWRLVLGGDGEGPGGSGLTAHQAALDAAPSAVADIAREVSRAVGPATYGQNATVFTDDRAPVERLTGRMMQTARAAGMLPER